MVSLYVALPGAAPSSLGNPHHHPSRKSTHALVPQTMEASQAIDAAFAQIKPAKINLSLFGRSLGTLEGTDHVDLIEGAIGGEVDDKCKAKGKHHGKHVA